MDLASRLDMFLDVVQKGSFAKAADSRNLDRSVLSKQIKMLESDLGIRLINRSTRSLSPTDAGNSIAKQAESIREMISETVHMAKSFHAKPQGMLRIASPVLFGNLYIQKAVHLFMERYPSIDIKLEVNDRHADIIGDRFDLAFRIGPPRDSNLIAKKLADNKVAILASHSFLKKFGVPKTPEELIELPSVIYTNGVYKKDRFTISSAPNSEVMNSYHLCGRFEVNDVNACGEAVLAGLGYAEMPLFALGKNIKELGLVPLLTNYKLPKDEWGVYAVYPHRNQTPTVKLFIDTVQELIGVPPIWEAYIDNYKEMYQ